MPGTVGKSEQPEDTTPREWLTGFYLTDRRQASRNLTVSLGLRYEYLPLMSRANRGIERYDPDTNLVHIGGLGSEPRNVGITTSKTLFAPRLGLAYRFMAKTVIRAGYGLSVDPVGFGNLLLLEYPTVISGSWTSANTYQPYGKIENGIPPVPVPDLSSGTITAPTNVVVRTLEEGALKRGYVQSFNLVIERELPGGFLVSVGYVRARTVRQMVSRDINAGAGGRPATRPE